MYLVWKLIVVVTLSLLAFDGNDATLTEQQQRGKRYQHQYPPQHPLHHNPKLHQSAHYAENHDHKCNIEIPTVALKSYPHSTVIRNTTHTSVIETCCSGYRPHKMRDNKMGCLPICGDCLNGRCVSPGVCECYSGFVMNDGGHCVFTCPINCQHGQCYLDGTCKCHPGYKLDEIKKFCRPICSEGCIGFMHNCTAPEVCGCSKGYTLKEDGCRPICDPDCGLGGECIEPNVCSCAGDYILKNGVCQAKCYQKCENGICFSRNRCICYPGFRYHEKTLTCIPSS